MRSVPATTYLILVGEADVPRMGAMNSIFDTHSIKWIFLMMFFKKIFPCWMGCGNGELTMKLAKQLGDRVNVVAIDRSEEQIKIARENSKKLGITNVTWIVQDAKFHVITLSEGRENKTFARQAQAAVKVWE